jgi:hypothetical protein
MENGGNSRAQPNLLQRLCWLSLVLGFLGRMSLQAQSTCPSPPECELLRQDEDYSYLRNPACKQDSWDSLKYVRLGTSDDSFLTIGGEVRELYERFRNALWGVGPQGVGPQDDSGYLLQRLSVHGNFHVSRRIRFFAQLTSNIEAGRNGGPRPGIDESKLWFEQAFADITLVKEAEGKKKVLVMRLGRQPFGTAEPSQTATLVDRCWKPKSLEDEVPEAAMGRCLAGR